MSCCVCCGCCCSFPKKIKIAACVLAIPVSILLSAYIAWLAFGTYLVVVMNSNRRNKVVCRNIIVYVVIMYIYLGCLIIFGLIVCLWKIHREIKGIGASPATASAADRGAKSDTEKQMKNMQRSAKLMSAVV